MDTVRKLLQKYLSIIRKGLEIGTALYTWNLRYNGQNLTLYNCEFFRDVTVLRKFCSYKTIWNKNEIQYKNLYVITLCVYLLCTLWCKGKVVPALIKHTLKHTPWSVWESGCIDPRFCDLSTSWRWVVSFKPRPLYLPGKELPVPIG
jgi:hypothetical protein